MKQKRHRAKSNSATWLQKQTSNKLQFISYCAIGGVNTCISIGSSFALIFLGANIWTANLLGYLAAIVNSYFMNRKWTFSHRGYIRDSMPIFIIICALCYFVQLLILWGLINYFTFNIYVSQLFAMGVYTVISFIGNKLLTFRKLNA